MNFDRIEWMPHLDVGNNAFAWLERNPAERQVLEAFFVLMARELAANDAKGNRPGWLTMDRPEALAEVHWHAAKLAVAAKSLESWRELSEGKDMAEQNPVNAAAGEVREFAADVANCALMVLDCQGLLDLPPAPPVEIAPHIHPWERVAVSALEIRKVAGGIRCAMPGCNRSGRCEYYLIGLPTVINGRRELICEPCSKEWKRAFADLAPSRERLLEVLGELGGSVSKRVDAIDTLADLGLAQEYRALAVRETDAGLEPEEILDLILGVAELEAVA